jgi:hypothetical protein
MNFTVDSRFPVRRPVTLTSAPHWWAEEARRLLATWTPPATRPQVVPSPQE